MEKALVIALLEKYWQAETTIAEEQALAAYFRGDAVDTELAPYRELFAYFREEAQVSAGPGFGDRILQRLGLPLDGELSPVVPIVREPFRLGVAAAAAAIILIVAGLFLLKPVGQPAILADTKPPGRSTPGTEISGTRTTGQGRSGERALVADTYDDPEQALAAVRHALLIAAKNLNQGRRSFTGDRK
jgi:hypothetical protein